MARKTKGMLPSGNIRVRVYDYKDAQGKKHYKSFTAHTKAEAQALAAEWKHSRSKVERSDTVLSVVSEYIDVNKNRLSPTTYKTYKGYERYFEENDIGIVKLRDLTNMDVQKFINSLLENVKPKTVKNIYLVLKPAVELKRDDFRFRVKLPEVIRNEKYVPSSEDIAKVYAACNCPEMRAVVLLAIQGMMRRGEIAALTWDDVDLENKTISINKSYALTVDNDWELKSTKENASIRTISITDNLVDVFNSIERKGSSVTGFAPSHITNRFEDTVKRAGVKKFSIHALRHFGESTASSLNIPPVYIEAIGGWERGSDVRSRTYDHIISIDQARFNKMYLDKIDNILGKDSTKDSTHTG